MSDSAASLVEPAAKGRKNNPEKTRESILQAAVDEFVRHGLSGARVDAIAERTHTSKRMIYYYFASKEQLYLAVLEKLYGDIRNTEGKLHLGELGPLEAIRRLIEFTFDHHDRNVDFVRIVSIENIHHGAHIGRSEVIPTLNNSVLEAIADILRRGEIEGLFRSGLNPLDIHLLISSFCFYRVSNRHTFGTIFQVDLSVEAVKQRHKQVICESVLRYMQA